VPDLPYVLGVLAAVLVAVWLVRRVARRLVRLLLLVALVGGAIWLWKGGDLSSLVPGLAIPRD